MLEVNKKLQIDISYGDFLDITFKVKGLALAETAQIYLSVKKELQALEPLILKECNLIDPETNSVRIVIGSSEMEKLGVGRYFYDLVYEVDGNRRTLNYASSLIVHEVVHNV